MFDSRVHPDRVGTVCAAQARRKFDELARNGMSPVNVGAVRRFAQNYAVKGELKDLKATHEPSGHRSLRRNVLSLQAEPQRRDNRKSIVARPQRS
ncbi:MAG TPA: hypothetical protein VLA16_11105 [Ideonella sp.]|nr:hypothetical protein [Ideonella sp.]